MRIATLPFLVLAFISAHNVRAEEEQGGQTREVCMWDDDLGREVCEEYIRLCTWASGGGEVCTWVSPRAIEGGE